MVGAADSKFVLASLRTFLSTGKKETEQFMRRNPSVQYPWTVIKTKTINMRRQRQERLKKRLNNLTEYGETCILSIFDTLKAILFRLHYFYLLRGHEI